MFNLSVAFCVQTSPLWVFNINNLCLLYPSTFIFVDDFLLIDYIRSLLWITSPFFNGLVILIQLVFGTVLFMDYNLILLGELVHLWILSHIRGLNFTYYFGMNPFTYTCRLFKLDSACHWSRPPSGLYNGHHIGWTRPHHGLMSLARHACWTRPFYRLYNLLVNLIGPSTYGLVIQHVF